MTDATDKYIYIYIYMQLMKAIARMKSNTEQKMKLE